MAESRRGDPVAGWRVRIMYELRPPPRTQELVEAPMRRQEAGSCLAPAFPGDAVTPSNNPQGTHTGEGAG